MQYYVAIAGKQSGPYTEALVRELLANGAITADSLAWYEGLPNWAPLSTVLPQAAPTPPLPAAPAIPPIAQIPPSSAYPTAQAHLPPAAAQPNFQSLPQFNAYPVPNQNVALADLGARFGAACLDFVAYMIVMMPGVIALIVGKGTDKKVEDIGFTITGFAFFAFIICQLYLLITRSQTVGKMLMKIKIVNQKNLAKPNFGTIVMMRTFVPGLISAVPFLGLLFKFVDCCFIFSEDRRCIHDHIAGTIVIKA